MSQIPDLPCPPSNEPLLDEAAVIDRITALLGSEEVLDRTLWILFLDADRVQLPVLLPVDDLPEQPDETLTTGLLHALRQKVLTSGGSVVLALERPGSRQATGSDKAWAQALYAASRSFDLAVHGIYLAIAGEVTRLCRDH